MSLYQFQDIICMLAKVEVEDEYIFDGVMTKIVSMDLENNGFVYFITLCRYKLVKSIFYGIVTQFFFCIFSYRFKCILHGNFVDDLTDFVLLGSSDNACVVVFFLKDQVMER